MHRSKSGAILTIILSAGCARRIARSIHYRLRFSDKTRTELRASATGNRSFRQRHQTGDTGRSAAKHLSAIAFALQIRITASRGRLDSGLAYINYANLSIGPCRCLCRSCQPPVGEAAQLAGNERQLRLFRSETQICGNDFMVMKVAPPLTISSEQVTEFIAATTRVRFGRKRWAWRGKRLAPERAELTPGK